MENMIRNKNLKNCIDAIKNNTIMDYIACDGYKLTHRELLDLSLELSYIIDNSNKDIVIENLTEKWTSIF